MNRVKCNYRVSYGLIEMIMVITELPEGEVWLQLAQEANVCFERIKKKNMRESWRWFTFPNTEIRMKLKVNAGYTPYTCSIKMDADSVETFTSDQVESYIEQVLLGL